MAMRFDVVNPAEKEAMILQIYKTLPALNALLMSDDDMNEDLSVEDILHPSNGAELDNAATQAFRTPATDVILDVSSIQMVQTASQISTSIRSESQAYLLRRLNRLLGKWFEDPSLFRNCMKQLHCIISGSTALSFILGEYWEGSDLDIYVGKGSRKDMMVLHLMYHHGYQLDEIYKRISPILASSVNSCYSDENIYTVSKLSRTFTDPETGIARKQLIDVIESIDDHPVTPILRFHTTSVMNWISADTVTILYPQLTFAKKAIVNGKKSLPWTHATQQKWIEKYRKRGFKLHRTTDTLDHPCGSACPSIRRSSHDSLCLVLDLGEGGKFYDLPEVQWNLFPTPVFDDKTHRGCMNPKCERYGSDLVMHQKRDGTPGRFFPDR